jgi:hypothetical protein
VSLVVSLILIGVAGTILVADPELHLYTNERDYAWILMVTGLIGFVLSLVFWSSWGGFRRLPTTPDGGLRTPVFAVGLALTSLITYTAIHSVSGLQYEKTRVFVLAYAFTIAATGVAFLGAVAAARAERWKPLVPGCVLGIAADMGIWVLVVAT